MKNSALAMMLALPTMTPAQAIDGSVSLTSEPINLLFRVDNIRDKIYAASGFSDRSGYFLGIPQSAFVEARYSF